MTIDIIKWIEDKVINSPLSDAEGDALRSCLKERTVKSNEKIIAERQPGGTLEILFSGKAKIEDNNRYEGRVTLAEVESGALIGELTFLNGRTRTADVTAIEDCIVFSLSQSDFTELMKRHHELAYKILAVIMAHQTNVIMSQRVTLAPMLRQLKDKAASLPMWAKVAPALFVLLYIIGFTYISYKDFDYSG